MAKDLLIKIEARDNASSVFQRAGRAGQEMGRDIEQAADRAADSLDDLDRSQDATGDSAVEMVRDVGRAADGLGRDLPAAADRAESSLRELDQAQDQAGDSATAMGQDVQRAGTSMRDFESAGRTAAAGIALLGTSFAMYANQARDAEIANMALTRTYGEAAQSFQNLANQMQSTTVFSNDQVIEAANIMGTLKRNYELTDQQIQQLIRTSADLAAVNGTTLVDAATRVSAAIRGEAESAETLGLTMNQAAIDQDNLTLSMSNAEAGAFRFEALMGQATFATGAAGEQADTTAGKVQQLANRVQDAAVGFVEWTGPLGQVVGGLGSFGLEAGLALAGVVQLTRGIRELSVASAGVGRLGAAFGLLTNPIALVGVGVIGMTALAVNSIREHQEKVEDLQRSYDDLVQTIRDLPQTQQASFAQVAQLQEISDWIGTLDGQYEEINARVEEFNLTSATGFDPGNIQLTVQTAAQLNDVLAQGILTLEQQKQAQDLIAQAITTQGADIDAVTMAVDQVIQQHQLWIDTQGQLGISGDTMIVMLQNIAANAGTMGKSVEDSANSFRTLRDEILLTESALVSLITSGADAGLINNLRAITPEVDQVLDSIERLTGPNGDPFWGLSSGSAGLQQLETDLNTLLSQTGMVGAYTQAAVENLTEAHQAGMLSADQYAAAIHELVTNELPGLQQAAIVGAYLIGQIVTEMDEGFVTAGDFALAMGDVATILTKAGSAADDLTLDFERVRTYLDESTEAGSRNTEQTRYMAEGLYDVARALGAAGTALGDWIGDQVELNDALGLFSGNMDGIAQRLNETAVAVEAVSRAIGIAATEVERGQDLWTAYNEAASAVVDTVGAVALGILDAASASGILSDTSGTIIGQTQSWGRLSQSVADWAGGLAHGTLAQTELDQAFLNGLISRKTYQEALEANHRIQVANAEIQEDLLRIQIKQMPIMAQAIEQQAEYVDSLADLGPEAQLAALGFMDQAQSAKALEVAQLAAASATDSQKAATTAMIQEMVNADPVLKAMLLDMGLISEGANGTIKVNFDDTVNATDAIEALNGTLNDLIVLLGDIFNVDTATDAPDTQALITNLIGEIDKIPEEVVTNVFLNDYASLKAAEVFDILNLLDGKTATTYINTVQTGSLQLNNPLATGGTIPVDGWRVLDGVPAFAGGGTMALVGEAGPELVRLPVGSQVTSSPATRSQLATVARRGDAGVVFNGPVTLSVQRDGTAQEAIRRAALARTRGY